MLKKLWYLMKYLRRFGLSDGLRLYVQIRTGRIENLRVPRIKHTISLRPLTSDGMTFKEVFVDNGYAIDFEKKPKVIIDGGSNIGLFAVKMKNQFPESRIICIEPDPDNFEMMKKNLSKYDDVFFENGGLWNKVTKLKVFDKYNSGKWGMVVEEDTIDGKINAISINSLLSKYSLDFVDVLKLDIETSEKELFSENYEEWLPKVKTIIIELHDSAEPGCSKPFFVAINKSYTNYSYAHVGENVIINNLDLVE